MASTSSAWRAPSDVVAVFHATFHATQGYIVSWSQKVPEASLSLDGIEFTALPSGLHVLDNDVIYFSRDGYRGVSVFTRRPSDEVGARGYRLESVGIFVANAARAFPWRHLPSLKNLARVVSERGDGWDWAPLQHWWDQRRLRPEVGLSAEQLSWEDELTRYPASHPALHLPHLLRILGPSALTLYKHVLSRKRVLIYAQPPVEPACILAYIASDICFGDRERQQAGTGHAYLAQQPSVLGLVTLNDLDTLQSETWAGTGWIACTTDAIFKEKPNLYDLLIDMSTANWVTQSRPTMYMSRYNPAAMGSRKPTHRLSPVRFTWSDVRLWNQLDRVLRTEAPPDASSEPSPHGSHLPLPTPPPSIPSTPLSRTDSTAAASMTTSWMDPWRVYEEACIVCAGVWLSGIRGAWAGTSADGNAPQLDGEDEALVYGVNVRKVGQGIEGKRDKAAKRLSTPTTSRTPVRQASPAPTAGPVSASNFPPAPAPPEGSSLTASDGRPKVQHQVHMTLLLLGVFHSHTAFLLDRLGEILQLDAAPAPTGNGIAYNGDNIVLSVKDLMSLELGPLSELDARFAQWLAEKTEQAAGRRVVVRRSWRDLFAAVFGFA